MMSESRRCPPEKLTKVEGTLFLDVVIGKGTSIFQLLAREDKALLVGWNTKLCISGYQTI